jgi:hypothetical protein
VHLDVLFEMRGLERTIIVDTKTDVDTGEMISHDHKMRLLPAIQAYIHFEGDI